MVFFNNWLFFWVISNFQVFFFYHFLANIFLLLEFQSEAIVL